MTAKSRGRNPPASTASSRIPTEVATPSGRKRFIRSKNSVKPSVWGVGGGGGGDSGPGRGGGGGGDDRGGNRAGGGDGRGKRGQNNGGRGDGERRGRRGEIDGGGDDWDEAQAGGKSDAFSDCIESVFRLPTRSNRNGNNNGWRGFMADAFEMFQYFAVLAVHLSKAVCAYVGCRLDEYAERALVEEEGEELDMEEMRKKIEKKKRRFDRAMKRWREREFPSGGAEDAGKNGSHDDGVENDDMDDDDDDDLDDDDIARWEKKLVKKATFTFLVLVSAIILQLSYSYLTAVSHVTARVQTADSVIDALVWGIEGVADHVRLVGDHLLGDGGGGGDNY